MKYLIIGLGNVGPEYEMTRHNAGFLALDHLAGLHRISFQLTRHAFHAEFRHRRNEVHLVKPTTFMNLSGKAVNYWKQYLEVDLNALLIVVDDIALPFGKLRLRGSGSAAGHNGLISIESHLGSRDYPRLRIGIGNEFKKGEQVDFVLSRFSGEEFKQMNDLLKNACEVIESFIGVGLEKTMSRFNRNEEDDEALSTDVK